VRLINAKIPDDLDIELRTLAQLRRRSISAEIREALQAHVKIGIRELSERERRAATGARDVG
jgi:predicted transcriptional regulator